MIATKATHVDVIRALTEEGWVIVEPRSELGVEHITNSRRRVLRSAITGGADHTHLVDMDRVLHWTMTYPEELERVAAEIPSHGFLIIGRTPRALATHPRNQSETETLANRVASLVLGREVDITAASRGIGREAAEVILQYSRGRFFDSDSEWPTILLCRSKISIDYLPVEGLEWETYLKRQTMALPDGRRVDLREYYESNPESWTYRLMLAHRIARAALQTRRELSYSTGSAS